MMMSLLLAMRVAVLHHVVSNALAATVVAGRRQVARRPGRLDESVRAAIRVVQQMPQGDHATSPPIFGFFFLTAAFFGGAFAQAKLDALGLAHLNSNSLAKDD